MSLSKNNYTVLIDYIKKELKDKQWDEILCQIVFNGRVCSDSVRYYFDQQEFVFVTDVFETGPILHSIFGDYLQGKKERDFNEVFLYITREDFTVEYRMNEERIKKSKQESALLFSNYVYEDMRTQIYDYEIANNLRTPIYDEEGAVCDHEKSWDSGLFTFIINMETKKVYYKIELFLQGEKRILPLELQEYFIEAILTHYALTHGELKEYWKPWNKIVVTAPELVIPLGRAQEYIEYTLESEETLKQLQKTYKNNGWNIAKAQKSNMNSIWSKLKKLWS
ncbi:hypothetical protein P8625_02370 [Tenacibaculum tangerinum]|uniref:Uncharacterized protein n=1 Tax=Tenacibaculum tangerinum TaxID=3038772 RepID=A0ABY8L7F9_9FLAO|nr:hypothetical protein [Tenacibaculum tangerinum]WGH76034.1 hypothetical protein P8625_02370 [Tenacibaculum tangerinum]